MIIAIQGRKYNFQIVSQEEGQDHIFFIKAHSKSSGRYSSINNLNAVLSEFGIETGEPKFDDSSWVVTKDKAQYFSESATEFLMDVTFRDYIEMRLDEDRMAGEWENISKPKKTLYGHV